MAHKDAILEALRVKEYDDLYEAVRRLQVQIDILAIRIIALENNEDDGHEAAANVSSN